VRVDIGRDIGDLAWFDRTPAMSEIDSENEKTNFPALIPLISDVQISIF
jgi:hypothetical protein